MNEEDDIDNRLEEEVEEEEEEEEDVFEEVNYDSEDDEEAWDEVDVNLDNTASALAKATAGLKPLEIVISTNSSKNGKKSKLVNPLLFIYNYRANRL